MHSKPVSRTILVGRLHNSIMNRSNFSPFHVPLCDQEQTVPIQSEKVQESFANDFQKTRAFTGLVRQTP